VFDLATSGLEFQLPSKAGGHSNSSELAYPLVKHDLRRQISTHLAQIEALAPKCKESMGDVINFVGTEFFIRDLDFISQLIEGEKKPLNCTSSSYIRLRVYSSCAWASLDWGVSYGTVIGQTLVKMLPPHRLGKIVIDGVVNAVQWFDYPRYFHRCKLDADHTASCS
jgi:hypothetical protein